MPSRVPLKHQSAAALHQPVWLSEAQSAMARQAIQLANGRRRQGRSDAAARGGGADHTSSDTVARRVVNMFNLLLRAAADWCG